MPTRCMTWVVWKSSHLSFLWLQPKKGLTWTLSQSRAECLTVELQHHQLLLMSPLRGLISAILTQDNGAEVQIDPYLRPHFRFGNGR